MTIPHEKDGFISEPRLDRGPAPRESVSVALRLAREQHGQDVRSVAQVLRIRPAYLEAIESGEYERLPGMAYALGFLRTYAEYLNLDSNEIIDRFKDEVRGVERHTELVFPEVTAEARIPRGALILISVVLLGLVYGSWVYLSNQGGSITDLIPALPERFQALLGSDGEGASDTETPVLSAEEAEPEPLRPASEQGQAAVTESASLDQPAPAAEAESSPPALPSQAEPPGIPAPKPPTPAAPLAARPASPVAGAEPAPEVVAAQPVSPVSSAEPAPDTGPNTAPVQPASPVASDEPTPDTAPDLAPVQPASPVASAEPAPELVTAAVRAPEVPEIQETVVIPAPPEAPESLLIPSREPPRVYGESNRDARIVVRANEDSWVQVRDDRDTLLLTRVLRAGDMYYVPNLSGLTLFTGNAGGIVIEVDGVALPPLGPTGAVRRRIALDPDRLLNGGGVLR